MRTPQPHNDMEDYGGPERTLFASRAFATAACQNACPVGLQCYGYIGLVGNGQYEDAYKLIRQRLPFPRTLGRICDAPCEPVCLRDPMDEALAIRELKRFVGDYAFDKGMKYRPRLRPRRKEKVAIVGAGPAGLSAAHDLARDGFQVTVFEELPVAGGMLAVGVPAYRLPREVLESEIQNVTDLGVDIKLNHR
ncbi:MAG: FAD-dependent oxidoreductase, partial [Dehalococcoidia bacterium]|nr:FAD-dependent oxidoreductase [Dehalococcoidia bacterium]